VTECLAASVSSFEERGLMVRFEDSPSIFVLADREMTVRIIQNLIRNCVAHSAGDVVVLLSASDNAVVSFKNPVKNAAEIDANRLFDRFYTGDRARSKTTGLGLSIVKLLAGQMGGAVSASLQENELAIQVERVIETLSKNSELRVTSTPIIGNVNIVRQIDKLKEKPHIIVGSPGRILELIKKRKITAHTIKTIVIDEADRLLDENNIGNVKAVVKSTLKERQIMLFSATMPQSTVNTAMEMMKEPEIIKSVEKQKVNEDISHMYFTAEQRDKIEVLRKLVASINPERALVFINKSDEIEITTAKLQYHGLKADGIHGTSVKSERKKALEDFRAGRINLLVASDIAARGLDIKGVTHIFNLDLTEEPKGYLHRAGRTGRAGESGTCISIITEREKELIEKYEKVLHIKIEPKVIFKGKILPLREFKRPAKTNSPDKKKMTKPARTK
jgi:superfamily II DNA/RNA helicase